MGTFEFFDHSADVGIRVEASSLPDLFVTAGHALMEWMGPVPETPQVESERVAIEADGLEELLVRWLQELLYLFQQRHMYLEDVSGIRITECRIDAEVTARIWDTSVGASFQEVKAVTYHQLFIGIKDRIWLARVILDI